MKQQETIFRIKHGSHLYGTNTPTSDLDYKEVHLPAGRDILMMRAKDAYSYGPSKDVGEKNQAGDVDVQSFSVHKLLSMIKAGDIIGLEMLFVPDSCVEWCYPEYNYILEFREELLSRQVSGYIGYCQRQAAKYGIRGSRVAAVRDAMNLFALFMDSGGTTAKVGEYPWLLEKFVATHEHSAIVDLENKGTGTMIKHFECCDRKVPYTVSVKEAHSIYKKVFDEYGHRSLAAEKNEGIDWKAMSHAVRVGNQAIELLNTGFMTFPRPEAEHLLNIKKGLVDYKEVAQELETLLKDVVDASAKSSLPEKPNEQLFEALQLSLYKDQIL